jgi:ABC-type bacteriocin/lantibiotic exporter with double-glycine peptidase domain
MVRQELEMSCGAACARQLLLDSGIEVSEERIRTLASFDPTDGTSAGALAHALTELHPGTRYVGGTVFPEHLGALLRRAPFLALLKTPRRHWVLVDRIEGELVLLRDPAGSDETDSMDGVDAEMDLRSFLERWKSTLNGTVYRM